jgi:catechol 2,3-dioxygenase-like lactoylglutathione lyase family enzyme
MNGKPQAGVERFSTITLQVADVERALHFYREGLGLKFNPPSSESAVGAVVGGVFLLLHKDFESGLEGKERGLGIELHFAIADADAYCAELLSRGIEPLAEPEDRPWGRVFSVRDPDGYSIEFVAPADSEKA